jgi:hypothetical protein
MNLAAPCFSLRCPTPKPHESFSGSSPECRAAIRSFSTGSFAMGGLWRASGKRYFSPPRPTPSNRVFSTTVSVAGKRIFEGRDKEPERASKVQERRCGDRISLSNPPIQGLFDENREISVRPRVCGGGRSRSQTRLPLPYSLLTGKRTGKNRYLRGNSRRDHRKGPGLYGFSWPFPVKNNRERFLA